MGILTIEGMVIRFILGGGAVLASSIIAKKMGGNWGGIFAAFPAVYLAALLTIRLDFSGQELLNRSQLLSQGAFIGMMVNIVCALLVGWLAAMKGWKKGLIFAIVGWFIVSLLILWITVM